MVKGVPSDKVELFFLFLAKTPRAQRRKKNYKKILASLFATLRLCVFARNPQLFPGGRPFWQAP